MELSFRRSEGARRALDRAHALLMARSTGSKEGFTHLLRETLDPIFERLSGEERDVKRSVQLLYYLLEGLALEGTILADALAKFLKTSRQAVLEETRRQIIEERGHL
jgi:hypothetical protein